MIKTFSTYSAARPRLNDGDVCFFSSHNAIGDWLIKVWQRLTRGKSDPREGSSYSHVGMVLTLGQRVFLLEASAKGGVRMVPLSRRQPDLIVRMGLPWTLEAEDYAMENLGRPYGLWEAIRAGAGVRELTSNDKFICTEYVAGIAAELGYSFPRTKQLPDNFYAQLQEDPDREFIFIINPAKADI